MPPVRSAGNWPLKIDRNGVDRVNSPANPVATAARQSIGHFGRVRTATTARKPSLSAFIASGKLPLSRLASMRGIATMMQTYSGGCQCGKVRYEVQMDIGEVLACNCSRCGRLGSLLAFAPTTQFKLLSGDADLTKFEFNKHMIQHQFCSTCGIQSFAIGTHPKTGAKLAAINVRCLDGVDVDALKVKKVDGRSL